VRTPVALAAVALAVLAPAADAAQLSITDTSAREGGRAVFTVRLDKPAQRTAVTADLVTYAGTAGARDFRHTVAKVRIPPGEMQDTVAVPVARDNLIEPPEAFFVRLSAAFNTTLIDGEAVANIENVPLAGDCRNRLTGTKGADTLAGTARGDRVSGGAGNDTISGLGGDDCLTGGAGTDVLDGGAGDDDINARDGKPDLIDCGPGKKDRVRADRGDSVVNCEVRR
jgi:Ca2+-binding RTX toxin-like protein